MDSVSAVCISLDRRPDRWAAFQSRALAAGLTVSHTSAVDASAPGFDAKTHPDVSVVTAHNLLYGTRRSPYEIDVPGAVGASMSHFKVWEEVVQSGRTTLVFEDDSPIPTDLRARLEYLLQIAPHEWDLILLHRTTFGGGATGCSAGTKGLEPQERANGWQTCNSLAGAHAYLVTPAGARKLLARARPIELHVDAYMAFMARLGYIRMLWHPSVDIGGDWSDSDIRHRGGRILSLPTDMERAGIYSLDTPGVFRFLVLACVAGAVVGVGSVVAWKRGRGRGRG